MIDKIRVIPATDLFATEIGISGAPLPSNGIGKKFPIIKYMIIGGIIIGVLSVAYRLHKPTLTILKPTKNEN
jgi:hypothetical protein